MTFEFRTRNSFAPTQDCVDPGLANGADPLLEPTGEKGLSGCITRMSFDIAPNARLLSVR